MSTPQASFTPGRIDVIADSYLRTATRGSFDTSADLIREYAGVRKLLIDRVDRLSAQIRIAQAAGEEVTPAWLFQRDRLQAIQRELELEIGKIAERAHIRADELARQAEREAVTAAKDLTTAALGSPSQLAARVTSSWTRPNLSAGLMAAGATAGGSPLQELFAKLGPDAGDAVRSALIASVATGIPVKRMARYVSNAALGGNLARALTISRTEVMRSYRMAHRASFEASEIVTGWTWHSRLDANTCAGCFTAHGTEHPKTELMESHPNCRCVPIPTTPSWEELGFEGLPDTRHRPRNPEDAFLALPRAAQRRILGRGVHDLYESGRVPFDALGKTTDAGRWGKSRTPTSLRELNSRVNRGDFGPPPAVPQVGEPPPVAGADPLKSLGRAPVADAFRTPLKTLAIRRDKAAVAVRRLMDEALGLIGQVHVDGQLDPVPLGPMVGGPSSVKGAYSHRLDGSPVSLKFRSTAGIGVVVHEIGHYLDHLGFGVAGTYGSRMGFSRLRKGADVQMSFAQKKLASYRNLIANETDPVTLADLRQKADLLEDQINRAERASALFEDWARAVSNSAGYRNLLSILEDPTRTFSYLLDRPGQQSITVNYPATPDTKRFVEYALEPAELWARSYAQYVSLKTGAYRDEIEGALYRGFGGDPQTGTLSQIYDQWTWDDFKPIADAMDRIIEGYGWQP